MNLEVTILSNLIYNEKYVRKVLPFLKQDYFTVRSYKVIFLEIHEYITNYNTCPSLNALGIECQERTDLTEEQFTAQIFGDPKTGVKPMNVIELSQYKYNLTLGKNKIPVKLNGKSTFKCIQNKGSSEKGYSSL